jgi:protein transport protein SEC20
LSAKQSLQKAQRLERELLVKSYLDPKTADTSHPPPSRGRKNPNPQELSQDEKTVNASTDVTLALRRTHYMMASELSRSQFAHEALQQSTQALADLGETYSTLDTLLSNSKNLLGTLLRSQKSDTWYLETAFYILAATIAWLVFRRLIYGPAWWLVYLPLKVVIRAWIGVFTALGSVVGLTGREKGGDVNSVVRRDTSILAGSVSPSIIGSGTPSIVGGSASSAREMDSSPGEESVSEQVGRIIDENQTHEAEGGKEEGEPGTEDQTEIQKNPKKRMWEEPKEAAKEEQRTKDEL